MADLFEGFKWREVAAIVSIVGFIIIITITRLNAFDARLREVEVEIASLKCAMNPEICGFIRKENK